MTRTTITIDDGLLRELHRLAAARGISLAAFIREALEEKAVGCRRPRPLSIGLGDSGTTDTARRTADVRPEPRSWR